MRRTVLAVLAAAAVAVGLAAVPAQASTGQVVVFSNEFTPLSVYQNPAGCQRLPITSHVLNNQTDKPVKVFLDPTCLIPSPLPVIQPGYGTHVSNVGSFEAS